jgi:hypothetical protein
MFHDPQPQCEANHVTAPGRELHNKQIHQWDHSRRHLGILVIKFFIA